MKRMYASAYLVFALIGVWIMKRRLCDFMCFCIEYLEPGQTFTNIDVAEIHCALSIGYTLNKEVYVTLVQVLENVTKYR